MAQKKGFLLYKDLHPIVDKLTVTQAGHLFKAIYEYQNKGTEPDLDPVAEIAFISIKAHFIRDGEKYSQTCVKRSEAGRKGGVAKQANARSAKQVKQRVANLADSDSDSDRGSVRENDSESKPPLPPEGDCVSSPAKDLSSSTLKPIAEKKDEYSEEFEMAWEQFGRTGTKSDAYRFWKKLTRAYVAEVMERMPAYVASQPDKQFRGHMSSWINPSKKKWRNEINTTQAPRAEPSMAELEAMLGTGKGKEEGYENRRSGM